MSANGLSAACAADGVCRIDTCFYPGHVRKAITFTLDDGNLSEDNGDKTFFSYTAPAGFVGVVNLISSHITNENRQNYIDTYAAYEIGNHGKYHAFRMTAQEAERVTQEIYTPAQAEKADKEKIYADAHSPHVYWVCKSNGWRQIMSAEDFKENIRIGGEELENIFDKPVGYYALPFGHYDIDDEAGIPAYIASLGYYAVRYSGNRLDCTDFSLAQDYIGISYNADADHLLDMGKAYLDFPDDGKLKYFCFGLHASDYIGKWDILQAFCDMCGHRPDLFWYATDRQIYEYAAALKRLRIQGNTVINPSALTLYIKVNGENVTLPPHTTMTFDTAFGV